MYIYSRTMIPTIYLCDKFLIIIRNICHYLQNVFIRLKEILTSLILHPPWFIEVLQCILSSDLCMCDIQTFILYIYKYYTLINLMGPKGFYTCLVSTYTMWILLTYCLYLHLRVTLHTTHEFSLGMFIGFKIVKIECMHFSLSCWDVPW